MVEKPFVSVSLIRTTEVYKFDRIFMTDYEKMVTHTRWFLLPDVEQTLNLRLYLKFNVKSLNYTFRSQSTYWLYPLPEIRLLLCLTSDQFAQDPTFSSSMRGLPRHI